MRTAPLIASSAGPRCVRRYPMCSERSSSPLPTRAPHPPRIGVMIPKGPGTLLAA